MKQLRIFLTWPIIFAAAWYFFEFQTAVIVGLVYLHLMTLLLFYTTEKHKEKLVQIGQHIAEKDGLVDSSKVDFDKIMTAEDVIAAMTKMKK